MTSAIVLAAGASRRMGRQKLLLPYGGTSVIGHIVDQVLASAVGHVCVVVGGDAEGIAAALHGRDVEITPNPNVDSQMLDSVRCGLRALPPDCRSVMVVLGDQPGITPGIIDAVLAVNAPIVVPVYAGKRGHPLLLSTEYVDEILTGHDEVGLRGLLQAHADEVMELNVDDAGVLEDMDTPEDYQRIQRQMPRT
ncbi:MAG TPA: nucleotidyltransferase family protein [Armatimonadota bacterium]|nr:nucleotidyltransferase family protein [Armatimonadota bacterium]